MNRSTRGFIFELSISLQHMFLPENSVKQLKHVLKKNK